MEIEEIVMIMVVTSIGHFLMAFLIKKTTDIGAQNERNKGWLYATYWSSMIQALVVTGLVSVTYDGCKPPI